MPNSTDPDNPSHLDRCCLQKQKYEPAQDKTYNKTCVTSKDSDQPVYPPCMASVLCHPSLDRPGAVEGACDQQIL